MNFLIRLIERLAQPLAAAGLPFDKACHVVAGCLLSLAGLFAGPVFGATLVAAASLVREAKNKADGGPFDWADILVTLAGGAPVTAALLYFGG